MVSDRSEGAGDEKVLFSSPSVLVAVALVPVLDCAVSDWVVSPLVDSVGAVDLALVMGWPFASWERGSDCLLGEGEAKRML